jgi:hypothetical protein
MKSAQRENTGVSGFSAYLGSAYLLYGPFNSRAPLFAWRNQRRASVRSFCAVGWLTHAPLFLLSSCLIVWLPSQGLCCALQWRVSTGEGHCCLMRCNFVLLRAARISRARFPPLSLYLYDEGSEYGMVTTCSAL